VATDTFALQSVANFRAVVLTACSFVATASGAEEPQRQAVDTIRPLLMQAVVSGSAHGVMVGAMASGFAEAFGSTAPIEVDVSRVHQLAQEGCARLRVATRQSGVHVASAPALASNQALAYEISFCQDGTFPNDGRATR
jgi:hypothetical protein